VLQICQQITDVFHAAAQPDEAFRDPELGAVVERNAGVSHRRGMADETLDAAE
jgi:hypothetical protein